MGEIIQIWYNNDELKQLVEIYGTTDKKEMSRLIKEKSLSKESKPDNKTKKDTLTNLDLTLKCWKQMMELRDTLPFKIDPMKIITGEEQMPEPPVMQMLTNGKIQSKCWRHYCFPLDRKIELNMLTQTCHECKMTQQAEEVEFIQ